MPSATSASPIVGGAFRLTPTGAAPGATHPDLEAEVEAEVEVVRWPSQAARRHELAALGQPRLLVLDPGAPPLVTWDDGEEWVRKPVSDLEVSHRIDQLRSRRRREGGDRAAGDGSTATPIIDVDGRVWALGRSSRLRPAGAVIAAALVQRTGFAVPVRAIRASLSAAGIELARGAFDEEVGRVRRTLRGFGLHIRTLGADALIALPH